MLFVSVIVSMEINRRYYFQIDLHICSSHNNEFWSDWKIFTSPDLWCPSACLPSPGALPPGWAVLQPRPIFFTEWRLEHTAAWVWAAWAFADLSRWPHCFMWLERSHGMQSLVFCQAHTMVKLFTSNLKLPIKTLVRVPFLYTLLYNLSHELLHHTLSHLNLHLHCMERNELSNRGKNLRKMMEAATGDNHICNSKNIPTVRVTIDRSKKCLTAGQADPKLENQSRSYINCVVEQCRIISTVILYESSPKWICNSQSVLPKEPKGRSKWWVL